MCMDKYVDAPVAFEQRQLGQLYAQLKKRTRRAVQKQNFAQIPYGHVALHNMTYSYGL